MTEALNNLSILILIAISPTQPFHTVPHQVIHGFKMWLHRMAISGANKYFYG